MAKTGYINARVEPKLKKKAEKVLRDVGINTSDAVSLFLQQVVIQEGLPFDVCAHPHIPNAATRKALREARDPSKRIKTKSYATTKEMFDDILGKT